MKKLLTVVSLFSVVSANAGLFGGGGSLSGQSGSSSGSSANAVTFTNLINYTENSSRYSYSSLVVTGSTLKPFLNGTWTPWSGSASIFTKGNTNFLFYESRTVKGSSPAWVFATVPALTNADNDTRIVEFDFNGYQSLPIGSSGYWTTDDGTTQDTTMVTATSYSIRTNLVEVSNGELNLIVNSIQDPTLPFSVTNSLLGKPLAQITAGGANSGQIGGISFYGIPFGQYVTNNQVGEVGFEAGKINYSATYNQKADIRMGLDLGLYFNTDASGGSMIERMVQMPTYYGTPNNPAGGWSRADITHWKGSWRGDLRVTEHTINVIPPARDVIVASTNDIPFQLFTNQGTGNLQFTGRLPAASTWTDNTNFILGGVLCIPTNPATSFAPVGNSIRLVVSNNWLFAVTRFATNPIVRIAP